MSHKREVLITGGIENRITAYLKQTLKNEYKQTKTKYEALD